MSEADVGGERYLVFAEEGARFAVPLGQVREVLRGFETPPEPGGLRYHGRRLPVFDFGSAKGGDVRPGGRLLVLAGDESPAVRVEAVVGLETLSGDRVATARGLAAEGPLGRGLRGMARTDQGPVFLVDLAAVASALEGDAPRGREEGT